MICPVCKGSGLSPLPHFPSEYGGYIDERYLTSGIVCGGCDGSGFVDRDEDDDEFEDLDDDTELDDLEIDDTDDEIASPEVEPGMPGNWLFGAFWPAARNAGLLASMRNKQREILAEISDSSELPPRLKSDLYRSLAEIDLASDGAGARLGALYEELGRLKDQAYLQVGVWELGQGMLLESFLTLLWSNIGSLHRMFMDYRRGE